MLSYRMANDSFFDNSSILIIDREKKNYDDRTWCFWENGKGEWDDLLHKSWDKIAVSYTHLRAHETVLESRMPSSA